jgi:outer membrane protein assembly factor BamB
MIVAGLGLLAAGCETFQDAVYDFNPFSEKDKILPGTRQAVFPGGEIATEPGTARQAASIGAARANDDWPQAGGTPANDPGNVAYSGGAGRVWSSAVAGSSSGFQVASLTGFGGKGLRIGARPVVGGGRVYVYSPGGVVTALSLSGGGRAWTKTIRPEGERDISAGGGVAYDQGRLYVATSYGTLNALDASSGQTLWTIDLQAPARGAPTATNGKVYVTTQTNVVTAVSQSDGAELWSYRGIPETAGLLAAANPAVVGDTVVVPYTSGEVVAFDGKGQPLWSDTVTAAARTYALSSLSDVAASPVADGGTVFAAGVSGETIAVDLKTGERKWSQDVGSAHTPVVSGSAVFLVDLDDRAVALDRATGAPMWSTKLPVVNTRKQRTHWAGPVLAGGSLWFVSSDSKLAQVDAVSGSIVATRPIGESAAISPIVASGLMIVVSASGTVSAYR